MLKQEDKNRIERYINGSANGKEKALVESLFSDGEDNLYLRHSLEKDWNNLLNDISLSKVNLNHLLDHIHHIIRKDEALKKQKPAQRFIRLYRKAAAIMLLPLLVAGVLVYSLRGNQNNTKTDQPRSTIYAPMGSRVSFNLPDGTSGMLNSGSRLSYALPFINRDIELEGEAWFEVKRDENHPFEITTGTSRVKVLGTIFNLSAYPEENYLEIVLQEGKVEFQDNKIDKETTIFSSERLVFQNGDISKTITDPAKYIAWTDGMLVFRGDPMDEVARRIGRWYNVNVVIANHEIERYTFRATFQDDSLEDVLKFLAMTSPIQYKISQRELLPDGTFKKLEVTIYKKE
jgi:ferric-dicitrate binding protein FerR (iron transport regulator)